MNDDRRKLAIQTLLQNEVSSLLAAISDESPCGLRNRSLIAILYRTGIRISECLALQVQDIDFSGQSIRVLFGKMSKSRTVGIDLSALEHLQAWLNVRNEISTNACSPIFCTLKGTSLSPSYVRRMLKRIASKQKIRKRVHPHGFRHTHAAELASEGVPINIISRQLGHSNIATTSHYLDHIAPQQVIDTIKGRSWIADEQEAQS